MGWPLRSIEWRKVPGSNTWHFFIKNTSVCGKVTSNGKFEFLDGQPTEVQKHVCKMCQKEAAGIKQRIIQTLGN